MLRIEVRRAQPDGERALRAVSVAHVNHVGESLVLALGAAVSPIPLTISILLLSQPDRGRAKAIAFAAGQVVALAVIVTGAALLLRATLGTTHHHSKTEATIDTVLGVVLLLAAARTFLTKPKPKKPSPQKQRSLAAEFFAGAGLMAVNVETLALVLAAVKELSLAKVGPLSEALTLIAITLITTLTATVPPLITMLFPTRSGHALAWLNEQTTRHGRAIKGVFLVLFGAYLLYKGLQG